MAFFVGLGIGLMAGATLGFLTCSILSSSKIADAERARQNQKRI